MAKRLNYELVAQILVEAAYLGDRETCEKYGITTRTIRNYRKRLREDAELSEIFRIKNRAFTSDWGDEASEAIQNTIHFLGKAAASQDPAMPNPDMIHAMAGSLKILSQVDMMKKVLDVRLAGANRPDREAN